MIESSIWYEKYKPQTTSDLVLPAHFRQVVDKFKNNDAGHLGLFSTTPGTGKSSTTYAILKDMDAEALWINSSLESSVDVLRNKIMNFVSQESLSGRQKIVVFDEFDYASIQTHSATRGFLDMFSDNCKFIFTANYKDRIIEPLLNRMTILNFDDFEKQIVVEMFKRLCFILDSEKIQYNKKDLPAIIEVNFPSFRNMINTIQEFSSSGTLEIGTFRKNSDAFVELINALKTHSYNDIIQKVYEITIPDGFYSFLFKNLKDFNDVFVNKQNVIMILAKYQDMHDRALDKNLNLCGCVIELKACI